MRRYPVAVAVGALAVMFAACQEQPFPTSSDPQSGSDLLTRSGPAQLGLTNRVVVRCAGRELPSAAVRQIDALGGLLSHDWPEIGFGVVEGITMERLGQLSENGQIHVIHDVVLQWIPPVEEFGLQRLAVPTETDQSGAAFFFDYQWNMRQIDADDAWLTTSQGEGVRVAILDTGLDPFHLALDGQVDPASASKLTSSPCGAFDVGTIFDLNFHGTFVGALVSSNGVGIGSVAPAA